MTAGLPKGFIFLGPNGQGYRLTRDLGPGEKWLRIDDIEAFGGAPEPAPDMEAPDWLLEQFQRHIDGVPLPAPSDITKFVLARMLIPETDFNGWGDSAQRDLVKAAIAAVREWDAMHKTAT